MIDLAMVVWIILYLIVAGAIFGMLFFLVDYVAKQFPSEPMSLFAKVAKIILVILAVLVVIGVLASMISGKPLFYWGAPPPSMPR